MYDVFIWDHEAQEWEPFARVGLWGLRGVLRELWGLGYDKVSYLVERRGP